MKIIDKTKLTYDDVLIVPQYSEVESRRDVDLSTFLTLRRDDIAMLYAKDTHKRLKLDLPFIAAPMDTVSEHRMAVALGKLGGLAIIHRFMSMDDEVEDVRQTRRDLGVDAVVGAAVGAVGDFRERASALVEAGANFILIDVAHGDHINVLRALKALSNDHGDDVALMAGNVVTPQGAMRLADAGARSIRVGVGPGAFCTTRIQTGCGYPQLSAIADIAEILAKAGINSGICADGGIRNIGDVAKAIGAGASTVMMGRAFVGTNESPGEVITKEGGIAYKVGRGLASAGAKMASNQDVRFVEGVTGRVPYTGAVESVIQEYCDGLRSSLSYVGCDNIVDFQDNVVFARVSPSTPLENSPHVTMPNTK